MCHLHCVSMVEVKTKLQQIDQPQALQVQVLLAFREQLRAGGRSMHMGDFVTGYRPSQAFRIRGAILELEIRGFLTVRKADRTLNAGWKRVDGHLPRINITAEGLAYLDDFEKRVADATKPAATGGQYL